MKANLTRQPWATQLRDGSTRLATEIVTALSLFLSCLSAILCVGFLGLGAAGIPGDLSSGTALIMHAVHVPALCAAIAAVILSLKDRSQKRLGSGRCVAGAAFALWVSLASSGLDYIFLYSAR